MSRKSRSYNIANLHRRRFIDDVSGETGYTNNFKVDHRGRMVKPENYDPVPPQEIVPNIPPEIPPKYARPKAPLLYRASANPYNFESSYLDRVKYGTSNLMLGELNPDLVSIDLASLQNWEELDVVWDSATSQFTNSSWNQNINFVDNILSDVYTFGTPIEPTSIRLPGED